MDYRGLGGRMKSDNIIKAHRRFNQGPDFKGDTTFQDQNYDFILNDSFVLFGAPEELDYMTTSGTLEGKAKSLQGKRLGVFVLGEPREYKESFPRTLCLSQKHGFPVIPVPDKTTAWGKIESFLNKEPSSNADFSNTPQPRLQSIGGAQEKWWTLDGLQGALKLTSLKFIDLFWAEKEHKSYPAIIAEEAPRYRYYSVLYMNQGIPEDKQAVESLRAACESAGAMFRTTTEKMLRVDLHTFGADMWKKFLADIDAQFKEQT